MTTLAATVSSTGISAPTYSEVLASLQSSYQSIYGSDVVLTPDTQDGQFLAVIAAAINDVNQAAIAVYNSFSPTYAQGVGLSSLVSINGLTRNTATNSTWTALVQGTPGTTIQGGVVSDDFNNLWNLPATVNIPNSGSIAVTLTAQQVGALVIPAQTLKINTPVGGWTGCTTSVSSTPGAAIETDGQLRQRQSVSTAAPSQSIIGGILAAVRSVPGVQLASAYENPSSVTNAQDIPANSIAVVVLGGTVQAIVNAIGARKTPGTGTAGNTSGTYVDPEGYNQPVSYYTMTEVPITVAITIKALPGYSSTTGTYIQQSIAAFISAIGSGTYSLLNQLYAPASLQGDAATGVTGLTQQQLDLLRATYQIQILSQSRATPPVETTVTGGPYAAGVAVIDMTNTEDIYAGAVITIAASGGNFNTTVQGIAGSGVTVSPGVPAGQTVANGADVYLYSDVGIEFYEIANATTASVTLTVTT